MLPGITLSKAVPPQLPSLNNGRGQWVRATPGMDDVAFSGRGNKTARPNMLTARLESGRPVVLLHGQHDTCDAPERLERAIADGTSFEIDLNQVRLGGRTWLANAHSPWSYRFRRKPFPFADNPAANHPSRYIKRIAETGLFVKLDFKSTEVLETVPELAAELPDHQKMGHAFVRSLDFSRVRHLHWIAQRFFTKELFTFKLARKAKAALGDNVPFLIGCRGLSSKRFTPAFADRLALRVKREGFNMISLGLSDVKNPDPAIVKRLWEKHGVFVQIKIDTPEEKSFWDNQGFPYLGLTDNPELATKLS